VSWEPFGYTRRLDSEAEAAAVPAEGAASRPSPRRLGRNPARRLVVITCMDARIDPLAALGLELGDANVIRNAGATISDDVLRSLNVSASQLGAVAALVVGHTDCAAYGSDAEAEAALRDGLRQIRGSGAVPESFRVEAKLYHVHSGELTPVA
jgi:carbonic anhydrase